MHGFLDAHWEYPNFLPDDVPHQRKLPFQIQEKVWNDAYYAPMWDAYNSRSGETACFRIVGEGYVAPQRSTTMSPAKEQFIFTKVTEMTQMKSAVECAKRMGRSGG